MRKRQVVFFSIKTMMFAGAIMFATSCKKEGCTDAKAVNYDADAEEDDGTCLMLPDSLEKNYSVPSTYTFTDESGNNTVLFSGQKQRLDMLSEMATYMKTGNTAGTALSAAVLKNMYVNSSYTWLDANGLGLTGSSKQLKNKTAENDAGIQAMFESYMDSLEVVSSRTVVNVESGASGTGGVYPNDGVKGPYLMSATGIEYMQFVEKGLMCAVFMNQMTINYLGSVSTDNNTDVSDAADGKFYTEMEHHWDEAYGYFTSSEDYPTSGTDRFWGKYANGREPILESATTIAKAFRHGRAAISNNDYKERDAQISIIRTEIEKVCAGTGIHYLNEAKTNFGNVTTRNHQLSEAWAFINGLRFGYNSVNGISISAAEIDQALSYIGIDFNAVTVIGLQNAIDLVASKTGLESHKANL